MIGEQTTLAELRLMPKSEVIEVIKALFPDAQPATSRRSGPWGNVYLRPIFFPSAGSVLVGHKHNFDHITWLSKGSISLKFILPNGETGERQYTAPAPILIKKDVIHEITALEDGVIADCIYALRDANTGEVIDYWDRRLEPYR
jgi:hypothetical protein